MPALSKRSDPALERERRCGQDTLGHSLGDVLTRRRRCRRASRGRRGQPRRPSPGCPTDSRTRVPPSVGPTTPAVVDFHPSNVEYQIVTGLCGGGGAPGTARSDGAIGSSPSAGCRSAAPAAPPRSSARVLPSSANRSASRESPSRDVAVTTPARVAMPVPRTPLAASTATRYGSRLRIWPPLGGGVSIRRPAARIPLVQEARIEPLAALGEPLVVGVANLCERGDASQHAAERLHGRECRRARVARRRPSGGGSARPTRSRSRPPGRAPAGRVDSAAGSLRRDRLAIVG